MTHPANWLSLTCFAAFFSGLFATLVSYTDALHDYLRPVAVLEASVIKREVNAITVQLRGERKRSECVYKGIFAYTQNGLTNTEAFIVRMDRPAASVSHPAGVYDFGTWLIYPTANSLSLSLYIRYTCEDRNVFINAPEIKL